MLDELLEMILEDARDHMEKTLSHLGSELNTIRAGRASPTMLRNVRVDYYGSLTPLNQMATVNAPQPDLLVVTPWDKGSLKAIERTIIAGNLGLNPSNDGTMIRIPIPPLSEERRHELVRTAHQFGENARVAIRRIRQNAKDDIKTTQKEEHLSEDMRYLAEDRLQKDTSAYISRVDDILARKKGEIMEV